MGFLDFLGRNTPSSQPPVLVPAIPVMNGGKDIRVKLMVPKSYLGNIADGPNGMLTRLGGIVFPYTPTFSHEHKANYNSVNVTHSNYTQYFYKNSSLGEFQLAAKFTVQSVDDAAMYLSIINLLRALTKMKFGGEEGSGSPPPICRLYAYGDFMFNRVPVAVTSFRLDLQNDIDYFSLTGEMSETYGVSTVPVLSTINLTLIPVYSRNEMQKATVSGALQGGQGGLVPKGIL
jgi:hypothetical protein